MLQPCLPQPSLTPNGKPQQRLPTDPLPVPPGSPAAAQRGADKQSLQRSGSYAGGAGCTHHLGSGRTEGPRTGGSQGPPLQPHRPATGRAAGGTLTFLPGRGVPVGLVIFLLIPQVTGVHRHCRLDFLLGHLHPVVEDLEELLRLLVLRQAAEEGVLWGRPAHSQRAAGSGRPPPETPGPPAGTPPAPAFGRGKQRTLSVPGSHRPRFSAELSKQTALAVFAGAESRRPGKRAGGQWADCGRAKAAPCTHVTPLTVGIKGILGVTAGSPLV